MRRWLALGLAAAGLAPLGGCKDDDVETGPKVTVEVWDAVAGCYARCDGTPALAPALAARAGGACPEPADGAARTCKLREGQDRIRISADFSAISFSSCDAAELPTITEILEDQGAVPISGVTPGCLDEKHFYAQKVLPTAPVARSRGVRFRVASGAGYLTETPSFELVRPSIGLSVARCEDEAHAPIAGCALVAGVDRSVVTVSAPKDGVPDSATLTLRVDGVSVQTSPVPLLPSGESQQQGSLEIAMPNAPSTTLTITAQVGDLDPAPTSLSLVAPRPLQLQLGKDAQRPDFVGPRPTLVAGDPIPACRAFAAFVLAPDGAPGNRVTIQTSQGTLDGMGQTSQRTLFIPQMGLGPLATAALVLPEATTDRLVQLSASSGELLTSSLLLTLEPVWPIGAGLSAAKKNIPVATGGAEGATLVGSTLAPSGARFLPDTRLSVVVKATAASPPASLPCGAPSPPEDLGCDPTDVNQLPGGCLLGPKTVALTPSGDFTIQLAEGVCFAGVVTVDVYSPTYTTSEPCLGDRKVSGSPQRLTSGPLLTLTYGP